MDSEEPFTIHIWLEDTINVDSSRTQMVNRIL